MIAWWSLAAAGVVDRVDLVSEETPWVYDEARRFGLTPRVAAIRTLEQVQLHWHLPVEGLTLGTSLARQSLRLERPLGDWGLHLHGGITTRALLPVGPVAGVAWRRGPVRVGASLLVLATPTWVRPAYDDWRPLPTLGVGLAPVPRPRAPWMTR